MLRVSKVASSWAYNRHNILRAGKEIGSVESVFNNTLNSLHIEHIQSKEKLGLSGIKSVINQVRKDYPKVEVITRLKATRRGTRLKKTNLGRGR